MSDGLMVVDEAHNYALGTITLSPWDANVAALHLSATVALSWSKLSNEVNLVTNAYQSTPSVWNYRSNGYASRMRMYDTSITFMHAVSGLTDAVVTWITDFTILATGNAAAGELTPLGRLSLQTNTATDVVNVGGIVTAVTTATGNSTTVDTLLAGAGIAANTLAVNGQSLRFEAFGTSANNANVKTLRVIFGTSGVNTVLSRTLTPSVANNWFLQGTIYRTGAATQKAVGMILDGAIAEVDISTTLNQTLSAAGVLHVYGQGGATNDIVLQGYKVWWDDFNN